MALALGLPFPPFFSLCGSFAPWIEDVCSSCYDFAFSRTLLLVSLSPRTQTDCRTVSERDTTTCGMSEEKMHDEKVERRSGSEQLEDGLVEDSHATKRLLSKMDFRYVFWTCGFPPSIVLGS